MALTVATIPLAACATPGSELHREDLNTTGVVYVPRSHSHDNYRQARPLYGALERGFASVEVDVLLQDGTLYIAHGVEEVRPSKTLTSLYLDPLREIVQRNGGSLYGPTGPSLQLLIDVKSEAVETYAALAYTLHQYSDVLTTWSEAGVRPGPVTVVLSGNRAIDDILADEVRYTAIDGRIEDDRSSMPVDVMPLVSADWEALGPGDDEQRLAAASSLAQKIHREGRLLRFWATPEREELWRSLIASGVDYIGTDDVPRLHRTLRAMDGTASIGRIDD